MVVLILILSDPFSFGIRYPGNACAQTGNRSDFRSRPAVRSVSPQIPGIQQKYPAFAKIIGHAEKDTGQLNHPLAVFYGSGVYVAELNEYGIVITNWHVVADAKASILVKFPNFESDGVVILADDVWDLAAIVIRKPPFLPVPISLEVPQIGEELWVGGYGQYPGLNGFKMQSARVSRYMVLGTREGLPAETLALDSGVRQGDSGGPIMNRYGELSGLLWGSDSKVTMGTFSLRLQAFLTQAQFQLFNQPAMGDSFVKRSMEQYPPKKIRMAATPAQTALQACGIFPISSKPVYTTREETASSENRTNTSIPFTSAEDSMRSMPPYPPVESPTLIAQRGVIGRDHPEVYPASMLRENDPVSTASKSNEQRPDSASAKSSAKSKGVTLQNVSLTTGNKSTGPAPSNTKGNAHTSTSSSVALPSDTEAGNLSEEPAKDSDKESKFVFSIGDTRIICVVIILFFLFFNAVRLLAIAHEK